MKAAGLVLAGAHRSYRIWSGQRGTHRTPSRPSYDTQRSVRPQFLWQNGRSFACENHYFLLHLLFKLNLTLAKMSFTMMLGTKSNDIRHSICAVVGQSDYVMGFQITGTVWTLEPKFAAKLTFTYSPPHNGLSDFVVASIRPAGSIHSARRIRSNIVDCV